jgi:phage baseplate assembly protein W
MASAATPIATRADLLPIAAPYAIDGRGRTAEAAPGDHLRQLIELVLFTNPGERVMRPNFGAGLLGLVFAPNSDELAATAQVLIAGALQTWLGDLISVANVSVTHDDSTLRIAVDYSDRRSGEAASAVFARPA